MTPGLPRQAAESARAQGKELELELDQLRSQLASLEKQVGAAQEMSPPPPPPRARARARARGRESAVASRAGKAKAKS